MPDAENTGTQETGFFARIRDILSKLKPGSGINNDQRTNLKEFLNLGRKSFRTWKSLMISMMIKPSGFKNPLQEHYFTNVSKELEGTYYVSRGNLVFQTSSGYASRKIKKTFASSEFINESDIAEEFMSFLNTSSEQKRPFQVRKTLYADDWFDNITNSSFEFENDPKLFSLSSFEFGNLGKDESLTKTLIDRFQPIPEGEAPVKIKDEQTGLALPFYLNWNLRFDFFVEASKKFSSTVSDQDISDFQTYKRDNSKRDEIVARRSKGVSTEELAQ